MCACVCACVCMEEGGEEECNSALIDGLWACESAAIHAQMHIPCPPSQLPPPSTHTHTHPQVNKEQPPHWTPWAPAPPSTHADCCPSIRKDAPEAEATEAIRAVELLGIVQSDIAVLCVAPALSGCEVPPGGYTSSRWSYNAHALIQRTHGSSLRPSSLPSP